MSILGQAASSLGLGSGAAGQLNMQQAYNTAMASAQVMPQYNSTMHNFNFEEIENGWVIHFRGKKWMVADLDELKDKVIAILVEYKLEK